MSHKEKTAQHINDDQDIRRAKSLRKTSSLAERLLWNDLRQLPNELALKFRRQHPIHPYIVDFVSIPCKLVVEIDGESHDRRQLYDATRSKYLQKLGHTILRFTNEDIYKNRANVVREITHKAKEILLDLPSTPPLAPPQGEGN